MFCFLSFLASNSTVVFLAAGHSDVLQQMSPESAPGNLLARCLSFFAFFLSFVKVSRGVSPPVSSLLFSC